VAASDANEQPESAAMVHPENSSEKGSRNFLSDTSPSLGYRSQEDLTLGRSEEALRPEGDTEPRPPPADPALSPLTDKEKQMLEYSWMKVEGVGVEKVGLILFKTIFDLSPETLQKFSFRNEPGVLKSTKLKKHGVKVVNFVGAAIGGIRHLDSIVPAIQEMGVKHTAFEIVPKKDKKYYEYYAVVGKALLMTLAQGLGKDFTPELETAWTKVYSIVSRTMIEVDAEMSTKVVELARKQQAERIAAYGQKRSWSSKMGGILPRAGRAE
jgi:hemoglobin-like flavoprotein